MSSNLNNTAKNKDLRLGVTSFAKTEKELEFPPKSSAEYPIAISERALREYIARGGEVLIIPVEGKELANKENTKE